MCVTMVMQEALVSRMAHPIPKHEWRVCAYECMYVCAYECQHETVVAMGRASTVVACETDITSSLETNSVSDDDGDA